MKKIAILQSNYIPWKGYFDLIASVDEFIIYDDMQFTKNDWRNRNQIKTPSGLNWLTIPVGSSINRKIKEVPLPISDWQEKHLKSFKLNYSRSIYFNEIMNEIRPIYLDKDIRLLTDLNVRLIKLICKYLKIKTQISYSWDYDLTSEKNERLVNICRQANAQIYISGPSGRDYINEDLFRKNAIKINWFDYGNYPIYPQLWGGFEHKVSIIDLLFNCGKSSVEYMKIKYLNL